MYHKQLELTRKQGDFERKEVIDHEEKEIIGDDIIDGAGTIVGERLYHAGMTSTEWKKYKWQVRYLTTCYGPLGISFMLGLENKFYSKLESK